MEILHHGLGVIQAVGLCPHVPQGMVFETRVHRLHLENVEKLVVVRGRVLDRMDDWEREFSFGEVLAKPFRRCHLSQVVRCHGSCPDEEGGRD